MSELAPFPHSVEVEFRPYHYGDVNQLLTRVNREFGPPSRGRWRFRAPESIDVISNDYILHFQFRDVEDAVIFGLKYKR